MRKRTRTALFFSLFFIFILFAPVVILYSQGYRFDFEKKKISQTGGIFLKIEPKQVEIYINDKLVKKTDYFFGSALLENLLPGEHKIKLKKGGYYLWEKNLQVKEKEVTEAKSIILTPGKIDFTVMAKNIKNFWPSPDGKKIVLLEDDKDGWTLKLYDLEKNVKSHLIEEKANFLNLEWSGDSKEIYLNLGVKENEQSFVLRLDKIPLALIKRVIPSSPQNVLIVFNNYTFSREEGALHYFNKDSQEFEKILEGARGLKISPDNKKLAFFSDSEIWIFYLKDKPEQPAKKAGERQFLARLSEKIGDVFWLNDDYLVFTAGDKIKIAEIDDRDRTQSWEIGSFPDPKIFFNPTDKKLYILNQGNLLASENLIK